MYKYIFVLVVGIFFIGCGPKYIIKKQYTPSIKSNFSQCLSSCNKEKSLCSKSCETNYQTCLNGEYDRAKEIYARELNTYKNDYDDYIIRLRKYNKKQYKIEQKYRFLQQDYSYFNYQCVKKHDMYACDRRDSLLYKINNIKNKARRHPQEPIKPSLYKITNAQQSLCKNECGCQNSFDVCYTNCGGSIVPYKFCVSNCE